MLFYRSKLISYTSDDFVDPYDQEEEEEEEGEGGNVGSSAPPSNPTFDDMDLDGDLDQRLRGIRQRAVHYNRSVRQTLEEDWHGDSGNAIVKAVNSATYSGNPANGLWHMRVRVNHIVYLY